MSTIRRSLDVIPTSLAINPLLFQSNLWSTDQTHLGNICNSIFSLMSQESLVFIVFHKNLLNFFDIQIYEQPITIAKYGQISLCADRKLEILSPIDLRIKLSSINTKSFINLIKFPISVAVTVNWKNAIKQRKVAVKYRRPLAKDQLLIHCILMIRFFKFYSCVFLSQYCKITDINTLLIPLTVPWCIQHPLQ